jgi:hypothetical protein
VQKFAKNPAVSFGDINLSEEQIRGNHNPGAGGWPTVKYFNKQTGYDGQKYEQKTSDRICEELGKDEFMEAFVMEQVRAARRGVCCGSAQRAYVVGAHCEVTPVGTWTRGRGTHSQV